MQIQLPVDVHLAVGPNGKMVLLVGGLIRPCSSEDLAQILRSEPLKRSRKRINPQEETHTLSEEPMSPQARVMSERAKKGLCIRCEHKIVKGKKLCKHHLSLAQKHMADARAKIKRTSPKKIRKISQ